MKKKCLLILLVVLTLTSCNNDHHLFRVQETIEGTGH